MAISSISSASTAHRTSALNKKGNLQQRSTDFSTLASALGSNNLTSAQNAFAALQKDAQSIPATHGSSQVNTQSLQQVKNDAQTLATTLASNNLGGAQKAFATLKQHSTGAHMHGHHRGGGARLASVSSAATASADSGELLATQAIGSVGSTLNVTA
jgi:hypothetical protein